MDAQQARRAMLSFFSRGGEPPPQSWRQISAELRFRRLAKGEFLVRDGDLASTVAFLASGLVRMFYLRRDGRELNKSFVSPPNFVGAFEALLTRSASRLSIQCLEDSTVLEVDYKLVTTLYEGDMFWQRFGRLLAERLYVKKARREASLLIDPAAERYRTFLDEYAELEQRIPDYHIASYLGVTPEALSRLKNAAASRRRT